MFKKGYQKRKKGFILLVHFVRAYTEQNFDIIIHHNSTVLLQNPLQIFFHWVLFLCIFFRS